jgi:hypothetical protein
LFTSKGSPLWAYQAGDHVTGVAISGDGRFIAASSFLGNLFSSHEPIDLPAMPSIPPVPAEPPGWVKLIRLPEWVRRVGSIAMVTVWMILILAALWSVSSQILHWLRQRLEGMSEVEVEPMSGAFLDDLLHLVKGLFLLVSRSRDV